MGLFRKLFGTPLGIIASKCFNEYQEWFVHLDNTNEEVDILVTVRIKGFGSEVKKQQTWNDVWRKKHPDWGEVAAGCTVSSKIPEVWCDVRKTKKGLVINPSILGHEMLHVLKLIDNKIINPDLLIDDDTYIK